MRRLVLALLLASAALVAGCGSEEGSAQQAEAGPPLARERYVELERFYRAQIPVDRLSRRGDPRSLRHSMSLMQRACERVDDEDPLLAAVVDGCGRVASALVALAEQSCDTPSGCARSMRGIANLFDDMADVAQGNASVFEREIADEECREAIQQPRSVELAAGAADVFRRAADAVQSNDAEAFEGSSAEMARVMREFQDVPSGRRLLVAFRDACGPKAG